MTKIYTLLVAMALLYKKMVFSRDQFQQIAAVYIFISPKQWETLIGRLCRICFI